MKQVITASAFALGLAVGGHSVRSESDAVRNPIGFLRYALEATCNLNDAPADAFGRRLGDAELVEEKQYESGGRSLGWRRRYRTLEGAELVLRQQANDGLMLRFSVEYFQPSAADKPVPLAMAIAGSDCQIFHGRRIRHDSSGRAVTLERLGRDLTPNGRPEALNPPVPTGRDPGGVTIALVDSGLNYTLPTFSGRLVRDADGRALGYDFWDLDDRPFDNDSAASPFFPRRHGTAVASVLLIEAPKARFLPYRYPRPDMGRMVDLVEAAAAAGALIVAMPMGSSNAADWTAFETAARSHPEMLFVVSAGNNGRDIDDQPIYPAVLGLENLLVVTSSDGEGRLAPGSNWGPRSVDVMVPAENLEVVDFIGAPKRGSGSSFAVPRVAALAARLLAAHPTWQAAELKVAILARARTAPDAARVAYGWIADPRAD